MVPVRTIDDATVDENGFYELRAPVTAAMRKEAARNGGVLNIQVSASSANLGLSEFAVVSRDVSDGKWGVETSPGHGMGRPSPEAIVAAELGREALRQDPGSPRSLGAAADVVAKQIGLPVDTKAMTPAQRHALVTETVTPLDTKGRVYNLVMTKQSQKVDPQALRAATENAGKTAHSAADRTDVTACGFKVKKSPIRYMRVAEWHNSTNSKGEWSYGEKADTTVESAMNLGSKWSIGGSYTVSNTKEAAVGRTHSAKYKNARADHYARTKFRWKVGRYVSISNNTRATWCWKPTVPINSRHKFVNDWIGSVQAKGGEGSEYIGCGQKPQSGYRDTLPRGASFSRARGEAAEIVGTIAMHGLALTGRSGYSENVKLSWTAERGRGIWVCATYRDPIEAGVVHVQNRPKKKK